MLHFLPSESVPELQTLVDSAGPLADFGYELKLLGRYLSLARQGYRWLLFRVDDADRAAAACTVARTCGARLALHYHTLTVEKLI